MSDVYQTIVYFMVFRLYLLSLKGRASEREGKKRILHLLVHFSNGATDTAELNQRTDSRTPVRFSTLVEEPKNLGHYLLLIHAYLQEAKLEVEQAGAKSVGSIPTDDFIHRTTKLAFSLFQMCFYICFFSQMLTAILICVCHNF